MAGFNERATMDGAAYFTTAGVNDGAHFLATGQQTIAPSRRVRVRWPIDYTADWHDNVALVPADWLCRANKPCRVAEAGLPGQVGAS